VATFVLVHGAMHGGWCWRDVGPLLARRGHRVSTPTLTGQGERARALSPTTGVADHVDDLVEHLWYEDLDDVHLVLHSYSGVLAGPVVERAEGRVGAVVFLGAFLAEPGESLLDVEPPEVAERYRRLVGEAGGWRLPASGDFVAQWGITDGAVAAWVRPRLTDFGFRCLTDPVDYDPAPLGGLRKVYVEHTAPPMASLDRFAATARRDGWETHQLACGHDMMLVAPAATADLLGAIAGP
jgi:pimeloyl-ACP methyl ester carboxylesterase